MRRSFARALPPLVLLSALAAFAGCSDDSVDTPAPVDGGVDASDSGKKPVDAGGLVDHTTADVYVPPYDAGTDAGKDAGDAGADANGDAGADADADAAPPEPTSTDGIQNGTETDVDCGGTAPTNAPKCAIARKCGGDDDCAVGTCETTAKRCATEGHLYATYNVPNVAVSYAQASTRSGDSTPTATSETVTNAGAIAIDAKSDILYASSFNDGKIYVTTSASTNNAGPTHTITDFTLPVGLAVDGDADRLFVAADNGIYIFDNASTLDGNASITRQITGYPVNAQPYGLAYDAPHDRLFVSLAGLGIIDVYDGASKATGTRAATLSRSIGGSATPMDNPRQLAYDWIHDDLYIANTYGFKMDRILVFANASTAKGNVAAARGFGLAALEVDGIAIDVVRDELYFGSTNWFKISAIPHVSTQATATLDENTFRTFTGVSQFVTQLALDPTRP